MLCIKVWFLYYMPIYYVLLKLKVERKKNPKLINKLNIVNIMKKKIFTFN